MGKRGTVKLRQVSNRLEMDKNLNLWVEELKVEAQELFTIL